MEYTENRISNIEYRILNPRYWVRFFQHSTFNIRHSARRGFTLVEMIVSLGLFTIIMFIATSAFLTVVNADRKARSVRVAIDNLNIALEDMSRRIKTGSTYYCGATDTGGTGDCLAGNTMFFTSQTGVRMKYTLSGNALFRDTNPVTSPEINITGLNFVVSGSAPRSTPDAVQPMVVIVIDGTLGVGDTAAGFKIQTTITERAYDN